MIYNLLGFPAGSVNFGKFSGEITNRGDSRDPLIKLAREVEDGSKGMPLAV